VNQWIASSRDMARADDASCPNSSSNSWNRNNSLLLATVRARPPGQWTASSALRTAPTNREEKQCITQGVIAR